MKNYLLCFLTLFSLSFLACSNDDDGGNDCSGKETPISVIVEGIALSNVTGTASVNGSEISVSIVGSSSNNARVFFTCPNEVGTYNLSLSGQEARTVTAFVPAEILNIILTSGCYDIVSIDNDDVVMRFHINEDDTAINGEISLNVN